MLTDDQRKALEHGVEESQDDALTISDDSVIDLGNYGAAQETIMIDSGLDTITLTGSSGCSTISTISIPSFSTCYTNSTYTTGPTLSYNNTCYTIGNVLSNSGNVNIGQDGISMPDDKDIKIGERSLKEFMTKMEERLSILVPDPSKLEKFEALKKAYEHYKLMEKLCQEESKDEDES